MRNYIERRSEYVGLAVKDLKAAGKAVSESESPNESLRAMRNATRALARRAYRHKLDFTLARWKVRNDQQVGKEERSAIVPAARRRIMRLKQPREGVPPDLVPRWPKTCRGYEREFCLNAHRIVVALGTGGSVSSRC
ncbi:hypothetical protein GQ54DRAFT_298977 [Martensiomyces pterosporus]|nr:hypothetical protein GQ54DRAFT_298977 [Martensiomyces pterosporus]